jgi:uncharacterized protein (DUF488 family)
MTIYTIGFTKTSAESFFTRIKEAKVKSVIDVRLHNVSQLAGFAKNPDLEFFLKAICGIAYSHRTELAPTPELFNQYKKQGGNWEAYEKKFIKLIKERKIETIPKKVFADSCLLCSEDKPHYCHRRLVAEYLQEKWTNVEIKHL